MRSHIGVASGVEILPVLAVAVEDVDLSSAEVVTTCGLPSPSTSPAQGCARRF